MYMYNYNYTLILLFTRLYTCYSGCMCLHRFSSLDRVKQMIQKYSDHMDMELQQRSVEYDAIFKKHDKMR